MKPVRLAFFAILLVLITSSTLSSCIFPKPTMTEDERIPTATATSIYAKSPTHTATTSRADSTPSTTSTTPGGDQPSRSPTPTTGIGDQPSRSPTPTTSAGDDQPSRTPTPTNTVAHRPSKTPTPTNTVEGSSSDSSTTQTTTIGWPGRQGDPAHTGKVDQAFPIALEPKWVAQPSQPWSSQRSAIVADHEMVVVADVPHYLSKVDIWGQDDGNYMPWTSDKPYEIKGELNTTNHAIYAFNLVDGTQKWHVITEGPVVGYPQIVAGRIYVTSWQTPTSSESPKASVIYCLDGKDGRLIWYYTIQDAYVDELIINEGVVVISNLQYWDNEIIGLNALTGELLWTWSSSEYLSSSSRSPVAISENRIFVVFDSDKILALDLLTGNLLWETKDLLGTFTGAIPVAAGGRLFLHGIYLYEGFFVFTFDATFGEFLWKAPIDHSGELTLDPLLNALYVSDGNETTALSTIDGTQLWKAKDNINHNYLDCRDFNCLCVGEYAQGCYPNLVDHTTDHPVIIGNNHRLLSPLGLLDQSSGELIWRTSPREFDNYNPFLHAALPWHKIDYRFNPPTIEEWLPNDYVVNADGNEVLLSGFGTWIGPPAVSGDLVIGWAQSRGWWDTPTPSTSKDLVAYGPDTTPPLIQIHQGPKDNYLFNLEITVYDYNLNEWSLEIRNDQSQATWQVVAAGMQNLQYLKLLPMTGFWEIEEQELWKKLSDGTWTLKLSATDYAGLTSSVELVHIVDTTGPMVEIMSPEDGSTHIGYGYIRLDGIASDINDVTQVRITSDGGRTYTTAIGTNGWMVTLPITEKMEGKAVVFHAVATDSFGNETRSEPVTITFPKFEVELKSGGRTLSGSRSLFITKDEDIDGDGVEQRWENEIINLTMPILELDEEEAWLDQFYLEHKILGTKYPMAFFVRVTGYTPPYYKQYNPPHPPYILVYIAFGWHKDWGAANSPLTSIFSTTDILEAHRGDTENVVMAWRVMDETNLRLEWVRTSSHKNPCQHHGVWSPWHRSCNLGNIALDFDNVSATQILCSELEFETSGHVVLYPGEDKHALYPSPAVCKKVKLHISGLFESCGWNPGLTDFDDDDFKSDRRYQGSGRWLFDGYNAGEPDPNNLYQLIDFLDQPDIWRGLTETQKKRLTGLYPNEAVWSGTLGKRAEWDCDEEDWCELAVGNNGGEKFCGGLEYTWWNDNPEKCSSKLGSALGQSGGWTDKGPPDLMRSVLNARYRVTFTTDSKLYAETNANLLFYLVRDESSLSSSAKRTILTTANYSKNNDSFPYLPVGTFETGDVDTIYINDNRPGPIVAIQVQHDEPGQGQQFNPDPDWFLKQVIVTDQMTGETWIAEPTRWITRTPIRIPLEPYQPNASRQIEYRVTVRTGDLSGAGTDGEVFIKLFGVGDVISSSLKLDDPNANDFERDTVATYTVTSKDLGVLDRIVLMLGLNNTSSPDWYCAEVVVHNTLTGQVWTFPVEKWLGKSNGPVSVEVFVSD